MSPPQDHGPTRHAQVSGVLIRALADVVQQRGIAPEALLDAEDLGTATDAPFEARISIGRYHALVARAIALTGDPAFGLHCGLQAREPSFDLVGPLVAHAHTLRHAIALMQKFHALLVDDVRIAFDERAGVARLRCDFPRVHGPSDRSFAELLTGGLVRMLEAFACARADLRAVCFEHGRPAHHRAYAAAFGGAERFKQRFTGVVFASRMLDRPHLHRDAELQSLMHAQAERRLERLSRAKTFVEKLFALLRTQPSARLPDMTAAAQELGISVRSLRRRLAEEGTSYRAVVESVLRQSACMRLRDPESNVHAIAHDLGFSDATAFHRAFKRWTGLTPADYRATPVEP